MLHDDVASLETLGKVEVSRASHVEYDNARQKWYVQSAKTMVVLGHFDTREAALAWEKDFYSPGSSGWDELIGGDR